jgi:hypothetical protein
MPIFQKFGGHTHNNGFSFYIACNNGTRSNNCTITYVHPVKNARARSNPAIISNRYTLTLTYSFANLVFA